MGSLAADSFAQLGPYFRWGEAQEAGLSDPKLYRLMREGRVERIAHGLYRKTDADPADLDLIEIASASERATICLASALARHDLTDEIPFRIDIALPRGKGALHLRAPVRWHHFSPDTFDTGRGRLKLPGDMQIGLYSAERSIIDAYRLRHLEGEELGREALKRWIRRRGAQPSSILTLAREFPMAASQLRRDLEILL